MVVEAWYKLSAEAVSAGEVNAIKTALSETRQEMSLIFASYGTRFETCIDLRFSYLSVQKLLQIY